MKQVFKHTLILGFLMLIFICLPSIVSAQGDPGCDPFGYRKDGTLCPIDSGLYILLAIGALYGIIKFRNQRKQIKVQTLNNK